MDATTVAVDLAKDVFEVAVANQAHRITDRRRLTRRQFESFLEGLSAGTAVVMEACGTAHYWGRRCQARGLAVRLIPVQYVRPYVRRNKTDRTDTEAMLEADRCAGVAPVPVKTVDQQALQALHRVRSLEARVAAIDHELACVARAHPIATRLLQVPGVGIITATAMIGAVGHVHAFRRGPWPLDAGTTRQPSVSPTSWPASSGPCGATTATFIRRGCSRRRRNETPLRSRDAQRGVTTIMA
jgi:transposase